ncbi:hypothetical protein LTR53_010762 [Teratosphaeriaceae sp. CCFEE 6253]|nr:hypothetical protein LTR53_010762 [Teratosphaeriaceae sp. CCFEE 6253]
MDRTTSRNSVFLRTVPYLQLALCVALNLTAAFFALLAYFADRHPHSALYATFTNTYIAASATCINLLMVAEKGREPDVVVLIQRFEAMVATQLAYYCREHLPWSLTMERPSERRARTVIGVVIVITLFYLPLWQGHRQSKSRAAMAVDQAEVKDAKDGAHSL